MVSTDIRPRTLLDEWIRRDIVSIVEIETKPHIKLPCWPDFFGEVAVETLKILKAGNSKERCMPQTPGIEAFAEKKAMKMLVELNKLAFELAEMDHDASGNSYRFRMGAYFHKENTVDNTKRGAMDIEPGEE